MEEPGYLNKVSFLIIDDNTFMRTVLRNILHHFNVRNIREASNGAEALQIMQGWTPDIIIVDWEMAPFDGIEFTRMVRQSASEKERFVPIIMISGHTEYWRIQQARNNGINEFLVKPLSPKALFSRIRAVIERPRPFIKAPGYFGPDRRRKDHKHDEERRKDSQTAVRVPAEKMLEQGEINALFNPGSKHPDECVD